MKILTRVNEALIGLRAVDVYTFANFLRTYPAPIEAVRESCGYHYFNAEKHSTIAYYLTKESEQRYFIEEEGSNAET